MSRRTHDGRKFSKRLQGSPVADGTEELVARFTLQQERRGLASSTVASRRQKLFLLAEHAYRRLCSSSTANRSNGSSTTGSSAPGPGTGTSATSPVSTDR